MTTESAEILSICLPEDALKDLRYGFNCPYRSCMEFIRGTGSLSTHLLKVHKITEGTNHVNNRSERKVQTEYHCPVEHCKYNVNIGNRHFSCMKLLKQHYGKVHAEKKYMCEKCGTGFGMDKDRRHHQNGCGLSFHCGGCDKSYITIEALMTHCRRYQHKLPDNYTERNRIKKTVSVKKFNQDLVLNCQKYGHLKDPTSTPKVTSTPTMNGTGNTKGTNSPGIGALVVLNILPNTIGMTKRNGPKPILPKPLSLNIIPMMPVTGVTKTNNKKVNTTGSFNNGTTSTTLPCDGQKVNNSTAENKNNGITDDLSQSQSISAGIQACIGDKSIQDLESGFLAEKCRLSTGIQTSISFRPRKVKPQINVAQTQTSGDLILKKAMALANIPIQMESVGTQMTPRTKSRNMKRANLCSSETQTSNINSNIKRRRRRKLSGPGYHSKMDSMCQTQVSNYNKSVSTVGTHTDIPTCMVDNVAQVESTNLLPQDYTANSEYRNSQNIAGTDFEHTDNVLRRIPVENVDGFCQTGFTADGFAQTNFDVPLSKQMSPNQNGCFSSNSESKSEQTSKRFVSEGTDPIDFDSDEILNMAELESANSTKNSKSQNLLLKHSSDLDSSTDDLFASSDFSNLLGKSQDMAIQTFEADFQKFLLSECSNISELGQNNNTDTTESQVQTQSSSDDIDHLLQNTGQINNSYFSTIHTQTASEIDVIDLLMNNMETQTNSDITFDCLPLTDIQTQTANENTGKVGFHTNADDRLGQSSNTDWSVSDLSLTSIHTQTSGANDDDGIVACMSTQTLTDATSFEDIAFDFSFANIQTQTTNQIHGDNVSTQTSFTEARTGSQTTESTQTVHENIYNKKVASVNMETQTSVFNFTLTDTQTQTKFDELNQFLSEFNQQ